jgi:hypothetical protein
MQIVKWGILITAKIAQKALILAFERAHNVEVVPIASTSGKAEEVANIFNIPSSYTSYEELLEDPEIDAVYIPLPNHLHKKWTLEAAKHRKHVLCEKPATLTAEETKEMVSYCREKKVKFMGKIQFGSGWWFNDHIDGMEKQMKDLANVGVLSHFIGMLTDSRSFLSYARQDYFRRILCNLLGEWVEAGYVPYDEKFLLQKVRNIAYENAQKYFIQR